MHITNIALTFHLLVELPASLSFLLGPGKQLQDPNPSPEAVLVCQSYGGLLLSTNVLCLLFLCYNGGDSDSDVVDATAMVAASLAVYHVFPVWRAWSRIRSQGRLGRGWAKQADALGGPYVHLVVHVLTFCSLAWAGLHGTIY